jgi:hypothetical protein
MRRGACEWRRPDRLHDGSDALSDLSDVVRKCRSFGHDAHAVAIELREPFKHALLRRQNFVVGNTRNGLVGFQSVSEGVIAAIVLDCDARNTRQGRGGR